MVVKTNHVIAASQFLKQMIRFMHMNGITCRILNHHVNAIRLRASITVILDTRENLIGFVKETIVAIHLVSKFAQK